MGKAVVSRTWPALLALGVLWVTCQNWQLGSSAATVRINDTRVELEGTWLREYTTQGVRVRHVLTLEPGGAFRETGRVVEPSGAVTTYVHEGVWLYDGKNLKRRYTLIDGKPPPLLSEPVASFQIAFASQDEFKGSDPMHGFRIDYRRVDPDTQP